LIQLKRSQTAFTERRSILSETPNAFSFFSPEQDEEDSAVAMKHFSKNWDTLRMNLPNTTKFQNKT